MAKNKKSENKEYAPSFDPSFIPSFEEGFSAINDDDCPF